VTQLLIRYRDVLALAALLVGLIVAGWVHVLT